MACPALNNHPMACLLYRKYSGSSWPTKSYSFRLVFRAVDHDGLVYLHAFSQSGVCFFCFCFKSDSCKLLAVIINVFLTDSGSHPSTLLFLQQYSMFLSYEWQESMSWFLIWSVVLYCMTTAKTISSIVIVWFNSINFSEQ